MKNLVQIGKTLSLTAPRALSSGDGLLVGSIFGVALTDAENGASVEAALEGVYDLDKAAVAPTEGALAYWDDTNHVVTNTDNSGANPLIGVFTEAAASGDATGRVRLNGAFM